MVIFFFYSKLFILLIGCILILPIYNELPPSQNCLPNHNLWKKRLVLYNKALFGWNFLFLLFIFAFYKKDLGKLKHNYSNILSHPTLVWSALQVDLDELPPLFCRPRRSPKPDTGRRLSSVPRGGSVDRGVPEACPGPLRRLMVRECRSLDPFPDKRLDKLTSRSYHSLQVSLPLYTIHSFVEETFFLLNLTKLVSWFWFRSMKIYFILF